MDHQRRAGLLCCLPGNPQCFQTGLFAAPLCGPNLDANQEIAMLSHRPNSMSHIGELRVAFPGNIRRKESGAGNAQEGHNPRLRTGSNQSLEPLHREGAGAAGIHNRRHPVGWTVTVGVDADLAAALVNVRVQIYESRRDDHSAGIDDPIAHRVGDCGSDFRHAAVHDRQIADGVNALARVDDAATLEHQIGAYHGEVPVRCRRLVIGRRAFLAALQERQIQFVDSSGHRSGSARADAPAVHLSDGEDAAGGAAQEDLVRVV